jgi:molybdenum cofactor guanylyltransferase
MQPKIFKNKFEGFVLAGGKSSRMKTNKAFLNIGNETFIQHAVKTLSPVCERRVKIILNPDQSAAEFSSFDYVRDVFPERGAPGGIHAALVNSKCEWAIILACDLPLVTEKIITELAKIALNLPADIAAVVPRQPDGRAQPLCALYRPSLCLPHLTKLLQKENSSSVRGFLDLIPVFYVETDSAALLNESVFLNVNTPDDYEFLTKK